MTTFILLVFSLILMTFETVFCEVEGCGSFCTSTRIEDRAQDGQMKGVELALRTGQEGGQRQNQTETGENERQ